MPTKTQAVPTITKEQKEAARRAAVASQEDAAISEVLQRAGMRRQSLTAESRERALQAVTRYKGVEGNTLAMFIRDGLTPKQQIEAAKNGQPKKRMSPTDKLVVIAGQLRKAKMKQSIELTPVQHRRALESANKALFGAALKHFILDGEPKKPSPGRQSESNGRATTSEARALASRGSWREGGAPAEMHAVLVKAGKPMTVKEITDAVIKRGKAQLKGKTPEATLAATLGVEIRKPNPKFKKVAPSTFEAVK